VGFCLKTDGTGSPPARWYINMCKHKLVDMPVAYSGKPVCKDFILTHGVGNLQIPFDLGSFRKVKMRSDGAKQTTYCVDVVFNPFIITLFMDDDFNKSMEQYRPFIMNLALKRIEESIGVKLSAQMTLVKKSRYHDPEDGEEGVPREFTELQGDKDSFDAELIQDVTPGARKPAIKKGFLNKGGGELYPTGSGEGVLPENAGDPMGWMPKKLRNTCKIVDCNSPEYQESEKKKKEADEANAANEEFRNTLTKDMDKWIKAATPDKWEQDLPDGAEPPACKYDVDYSRFDNIEDVDEKPAAEERDWYYDHNGVRRQKQTQPSRAAPEVTPEAPDAEGSIKKGFFDGAKKALYPKGSEQGGKASKSEEELLKEFVKSAGVDKAPGGYPASASRPGGEAQRSGMAVKKQESKSADFSLNEISDGLQLVISVPGLESMKNVNLDVTDRRAALEFPSAAGLKPLQVDLPKSVAPQSVKAKFSKKTSQITVTLPLGA